MRFFSFTFILYFFQLQTAKLNSTSVDISRTNLQLFQCTATALHFGLTTFIRQKCLSVTEELASIALTLPLCSLHPQLSPCCSPTADWWDSFRCSSPPPPLNLWPHPSVLPRPWRAAIYSCPRSLLCSAFTPLRCSPSSEFRPFFPSHPELRDMSLPPGRDREGFEVHCARPEFQMTVTVNSKHDSWAKTMHRLKWSYLPLNALSGYCSMIILPPLFFSKVPQSVSWNLETAVQQLLLQKRSTDDLLLGNELL